MKLKWKHVYETLSLMSDIYIIIINVKYSSSSIQHSIGSSSQSNWRSKKKKKTIKDIQIRKKDVK